MKMIDRTAHSPKEYRVRARQPHEVTALVIHQSGIGTWAPTNPMWDKVRAHCLVMRSGEVRLLCDPDVRMKYGAGQANAYAINIEHEGNYPSDRGQWYRPEVYGRTSLQPEMVAASRELLVYLVERYPSLTTVYAHRHLSASRSNDPGPDLWREVGCYAVDARGLSEGQPRYGGQGLPDSWSVAPVSKPPIMPYSRSYEGLTAVPTQSTKGRE